MLGICSDKSVRVPKSVIKKMPAFKINWITYLKYCIVLNLSATFVAFSFTVSNGGWSKFTLEELFICFVFSNLIGSPLWFLITIFSDKWNQGSMIVTVLKLTVMIFSITLFSEVIARFIIRRIFDLPRYQDIFPCWQQFLFSLTMASFGFGLLSYEILQKKLRQKEVDEQKAKTLATEAQLASLESRIHPHFLFNTLNSISALITENPAMAEEMMENLSDLLRYSLDSSSRSLVSLKQELEITEKYLEMEKIRYEDRLTYQIKCDEHILSTKLPPLSLQTLVENSIKHAVSKTSDLTSIIISVQKNEANIEIEVTDTGKGFTEKDLQPNHGLDNLQKRLQTLFDGKSYLQIIGNGTVKLQLPA
jgi:sensor histidine kinase YesM